MHFYRDLAKICDLLHVCTYTTLF